MNETESIVYAVDYNVRIERHLTGTSITAHVRNPTVLITDCVNVGYSFHGKGNDREAILQGFLFVFFCVIFF